ncbi:hypothetical protein DJ568_00920 [Mucilaginibacter hurinus]|uniref:DUF3667 domain-containing protein n=1 Tax=Mucilaginibacter hurinus TaxID=2201324 RepID=A0A367GUV1_9SPHI|nr:DUF3667 domain-containing protein [Mucilaginibacter hurinus]RCH56453.1 hypothetical protein DJ568_00920 [Mucilaginibacter hurinus]
MHSSKVTGAIKCKNCYNRFEGNFCNNCGQDADTKRINIHYFLDALQHKYLKLNKGFFFTVYGLFVRPGNTIKDYLDGKRVEYFKPFDLIYCLVVCML